jgi:organic hydroperoxide reductase OsmC/OhrA
MATAAVNNGVNVQALLDAREALKGAPEATKFTWRASCKWQNGTHSKTDVQSFFGLGQEQAHKTQTSFDADHPEIFASEDKGITPIEYVLVGLASCLTAGVAAVAQNRGVQLRSVESQLEGKMGHPRHSRHGRRCAERLRRYQGEVQDRFRRAEEGDRGDRRAVAETFRGVRRHCEPGERLRRSRLTTRTAAVVVGAGHAGLAASRLLTERSIDHIVLERGEVANSWRRERWDSLRLLTPNFQSRLPGYRYDGPDADGYMTMREVIEFISRYADVSRATRAHETRPSRRFSAPTMATDVATSDGDFQCRDAS